MCNVYEIHICIIINAHNEYMMKHIDAIENRLYGLSHILIPNILVIFPLISICIYLKVSA